MELEEELVEKKKSNPTLKLEDRDNRKILLKEGLETFQRERTRELIEKT